MYAPKDFLKDPLRIPVARVLERQLRRTPAQLGLVIVYHRTGPRRADHSREIDPAVSRSDLHRQLTLLDLYFRVVAADEILEASSTRRVGQPFPVAITFDDDLACHLDHAAPVLQALRLPATFFLTGASLDGPNPHWWDDLQRAIDSRCVEVSSFPEVDAELFQAALARAPGALHRTMRTIATLPAEQRNEVVARLRRVAGAGGDRGLRTADVQALCRAGLTIGFHTLRHYELPTLDSSALVLAMHEGRERLAEAAAMELTTIGYPHGACDERVATAARQAGFRLGFTTAPKPVVADDDALQVGRFVPSHGPPKSLLLQVLGALRAAYRAPALRALGVR